MQVPAILRVMSKPATVQTAVVDDVSVTVKPDVDVAVTVRGEPSRVCGAGLRNVMAWVSFVTENERVNDAAAA